MSSRTIWLAGGTRTPFTRVDGGLKERDAISMAVPVVIAMAAQAQKIDMAIWGSVIPDLGFSNLGREIWMDANLDATVPAATVVMACSTSMKAAFDAAGLLAGGHGELALVGGSETMTHVQVGLRHGVSDWIRKVGQAKSLGDRISEVGKLPIDRVGLDIPAIKNRTTGKSMGEHAEEMAKTWSIARADSDALALTSHQRAVAGQDAGFFTDLLVAVDEAKVDAFPRRDSTLAALAKLRPVFDREHGTITAGSSSPLTDGAAGIFVASDEGLKRLPSGIRRCKLVDLELGAVDIRHEGLLMAPAYSIPRLLARNSLTYADIGLWEIHEAFSAQVLCHLSALDSKDFVTKKAGVTAALGTVPRDRLNPNGGSVALGHPFGATGARILAQAVKELSERGKGERAIVSICADGGVGTVALLEAA